MISPLATYSAFVDELPIELLVEQLRPKITDVLHNRLRNYKGRSSIIINECGTDKQNNTQFLTATFSGNHRRVNDFLKIKRKFRGFFGHRGIK
jgi:hypothetical protein